MENTDKIVPVGAIIGDTMGSTFEGQSEVAEDYELIRGNCCFTDDSVMTIAILKAVREYKKNKGLDLKDLAIYYMQKLGRRYLWAGYGQMFMRWLFTDEPEPYGSYGNGAAMRVSPCGWYAESFTDALYMAELVTEVTHNHPDAIKGAKAVAGWIYLARQGWDKKAIFDRLIQENLYEPSEDIERGKFDITCKGTVNIAIHSVMNCNSFEEILRDAISYGGDTDTNACIACSMAEPLYDIPANLKEYVINRLRYKRSDGLEEVMLYNLLYDMDNDYEKQILDKGDRG